jgi:hypothetical protein
VSPYLDVYSVTIANISRNSIFVLINIGSSKQTVETLIDSGTGGLFIDQNYAKNFDINYLEEPVNAYNVDGMENKRGTINACVNLEFSLGEQKFKERFYVTGLGKQKSSSVFPGYINTTQTSTGRREKSLLNPSESTGDALWKKANEFEWNNNLR